MATIQCRKLNELAILPTKGSYQSAGFDLYAAIEEPVIIPPGENIKIGTGWAFSLPNGFFAGIYARSGLSTKQGLRPANCVGVCDADYTGEYIVALYNDSKEEQTINPGDRIAQVIFQQYPIVSLLEVEQLTETERGAGGFGSTGA